METIGYNDGLETGGRTPRLYLVKGYDYYKFSGSNIEGVCAVTSSSFNKNGKWSSTSYNILLALGVKAIPFLSRLHGIWGDNFNNWGEMSEKLGIFIGTIQEIVRKEYPRTAKRLDDLEKFSLDMENNSETVEVVIISFGSPTNRRIKEGFWKNPQERNTSTGIKVVVAPSSNDDWSKPVLIEPENGKILTSYTTPGHHGGYVTIEVAIPINSN